MLALWAVTIAASGHDSSGTAGAPAGPPPTPPALRGTPVSGESETSSPPPTPSREAQGHQLAGMASWYGGKFQGRLTANGETFDTNQLTAAHRTLPFDTIVRVTNQTNGHSVIVRINDRGPFVDDRVIDLSRAAADIIGLTAAGVAPVRLDVLHYQQQTDLRTVQVGSFGERGNAAAVVERLHAAGFSAAIETVADAGVHRVILQGIPEGDLPDVRRRLAGLGYHSVLVRQK